MLLARCCAGALWWILETQDEGETSSLVGLGLGVGLVWDQFFENPNHSAYINLNQHLTVVTTVRSFAVITGPSFSTGTSSTLASTFSISVAASIGSLSRRLLPGLGVGE